MFFVCFIKLNHYVPETDISDKLLRLTKLSSVNKMNFSMIFLLEKLHLISALKYINI